jgi:hypothetical protein
MMRPGLLPASPRRPGRFLPALRRHLVQRWRTPGEGRSKLTSRRASFPRADCRIRRELSCLGTVVERRLADLIGKGIPLSSGEAAWCAASSSAPDTQSTRRALSVHGLSAADGPGTMPIDWIEALDRGGALMSASLYEEPGATSWHRS